MTAMERAELLRKEWATMNRIGTDWPMIDAPEIAAAIDAALADEREECALIADEAANDAEMSDRPQSKRTAEALAAAIRARGR